MKRVKIIFCLATALVLTLCACAGTAESAKFNMLVESYDSASASSAAPAAAAPAEAPAAEYAAQTAPAPAGGESASLEQGIEGIATPGAGDERKIITTIDLRMESKEYDKTANTIFDAVKAAGGYIEFSDIAGNIKTPESSGVSAFGNAGPELSPMSAPPPGFEIRSGYYTEGDRRFMQLRIRIPQTNLSGFLSQIEASGNVLSKQESAEDITLEYVDTESHIAALVAERERLLAMLEKAEDVEALIALEKRLSEIRYQLERYESTLRVYQNRIAYATVNLTLNEVLIYTENPEAPVTVGERISLGWSQTLSGIQNYWKNQFVWFAVNLIYIIPALIGVVIAIIILRRLIRRFAAYAAAKLPPPDNDSGELSREEAGEIPEDGQPGEETARSSGGEQPQERRETKKKQAVAGIERAPFLKKLGNVAAKLYTPPYARLIRLFYITTAANAYAAVIGMLGDFLTYHFWTVIYAPLIITGMFVWMLSYVTAPLTVLGVFMLDHTQKKRREEPALARKTRLIILILQGVCAVIAWIAWGNQF